MGYLIEMSLLMVRFILLGYKNIFFHPNPIKEVDRLIQTLDLNHDG